LRMTSLKWENSGCASNSEGFIGGALASRVPALRRTSKHGWCTTSEPSSC
jgi:hypothetical protein